jgi:Flp pilus assembly pilin Flp
MNLKKPDARAKIVEYALTALLLTVAMVAAIEALATS